MQLEELMSNLKETVTFLEKVSFFGGLKKRQLENLAKRMVSRSYRKGDPIVVQGQGGEGFFIVTSGKAEAIRRRADGDNLVVNEFSTGDFFGELALLDDGPRTATITATEETTCLVLVRWDFLSLLREDADMAVEILLELARRFRTTLDSM
jgi:CRP/FNR family transcriptional regulator, cyclic AMP receptor protein